MNLEDNCKVLTDYYLNLLQNEKNQNKFKTYITKNSNLSYDKVISNLKDIKSDVLAAKVKELCGKDSSVTSKKVKNIADYIKNRKVIKGGKRVKSRKKRKKKKHRKIKNRTRKKRGGFLGDLLAFGGCIIMTGMVILTIPGMWTITNFLFKLTDEDDCMYGDQMACHRLQSGYYD
jgi:hypothetical protein